MLAKTILTILNLLLNDMRDVYKNIDEYNPDKKNKILIAFDDNDS